MNSEGNAQLSANAVALRASNPNASRRLRLPVMIRNNVKTAILVRLLERYTTCYHRYEWRRDNVIKDIAARKTRGMNSLYGGSLP
jgi:hypothetical protein